MSRSRKICVVTHSGWKNIRATHSQNAYAVLLCERHEEEERGEDQEKEHRRLGARGGVGKPNWLSGCVLLSLSAQRPRQNNQKEEAAALTPETGKRLGAVEDGEGASQRKDRQAEEGRAPMGLAVHGREQSF